jgi:hypothetical protein
LAYALELLDQWQRDLQLLPKLESLAGKADALLNLEPLISGSSCKVAEPLASYKGEKAVFQNELNRIRKFVSFQELATYLGRKKESYQAHAQGFWGQWTKKRVTWDVLAGFGQAAQILNENDGAEKNWHTLKDSISWYVEQGWRVDAEGESLMREWAVEEEDLFAVQKTLRNPRQYKVAKTISYVTPRSGKKGISGMDRAF